MIDETRVDQDDQSEDTPIICVRCGEEIDDPSNYIELVLDIFDDREPFHLDPCSYQARESGYQDPPVFIADMASRIGREEHTVRRWVRESEKVFGYAGDVPEDQGFLPRDMWPEREEDGRKRIWWRADQIDDLKDFAEVKGRRKGWHGSSRS